MESKIFAFVDWGEDELEVGYLVGVENEMTRSRFCRTGQGLEQLQAFLLEGSGRCASRVHVAIERSDGAVVETLLDSGFNTYSINPKQIDSFRSRHRSSVARDDKFDCYVGARALRTDPDCFRQLNSLNALNVELRGWYREHGQLTKNKCRVVLQLRQQLLSYYPQLLELADLESKWLIRLWRLVPTPQSAASADEQVIADVVKACRRFTAAQVLQVLCEKPLTVSEGNLRASVGRARLLFARLELLGAQLKQVAGEIRRLLSALDAEHAVSEPTTYSDGAVIRSFPGAGIGLEASLLGEAPEQIRTRDLETLRAISGVAPVTDASGKQQNRYRKAKKPLIMMRRACNARLREALFHLGRNAPLQDPYYKRMYTNMRGRGLSHGRACRQIADNILTILFAMLRDRTVYDPSRRRHQVTEVRRAA